MAPVGRHLERLERRREDLADALELTLAPVDHDSGPVLGVLAEEVEHHWPPEAIGFWVAAARRGVVVRGGLGARRHPPGAQQRFGARERRYSASTRNSVAFGTPRSRRDQAGADLAPSAGA